MKTVDGLGVGVLNANGVVRKGVKERQDNEAAAADHGSETGTDEPFLDHLEGAVANIDRICLQNANARLHAARREAATERNAPVAAPPSSVVAGGGGL